MARGIDMVDEERTVCISCSAKLKTFAGVEKSVFVVSICVL